jgi:hypothetical protein
MFFAWYSFHGYVTRRHTFVSGTHLHFLVWRGILKLLLEEYCVSVKSSIHLLLDSVWYRRFFEFLEKSSWTKIKEFYAQQFKDDTLSSNYNVELKYRLAFNSHKVNIICRTIQHRHRGIEM